MLTDLKQIEKQAGEKWDENSRFRRWLREQDPKSIEPIIDQHSREISSQIDCTQCANCCRALTIVPKSNDIYRLATALDLEVHEFKTKYLKKDHEGDLVFKQRPCPFLKGSKCGVYNSRPDTCRSYPHLEKSHMAGRGWYILENAAVCPIVFNVYEQLKGHFNWRQPTDESSPSMG